MPRCPIVRRSTLVDIEVTAKLNHLKIRHFRLKAEVDCFQTYRRIFTKASQTFLNSSFSFYKSDNYSGSEDPGAVYRGVEYTWNYACYGPRRNSRSRATRGRTSNFAKWLSRYVPRYVKLWISTNFIFRLSYIFFINNGIIKWVW